MHVESGQCIQSAYRYIVYRRHAESNLATAVEDKLNITYFVCPILCIRPTACLSNDGFNDGSTRITWVASIMFKPLEPD